MSLLLATERVNYDLCAKLTVKVYKASHLTLVFVFV